MSFYDLQERTGFPQQGIVILAQGIAFPKQGNVIPRLGNCNSEGWK